MATSLIVGDRVVATQDIYDDDGSEIVLVAFEGDMGTIVHIDLNHNIPTARFNRSGFATLIDVETEVQLVS